MDEARLWFRAKRFGWGWTPATWEGWLVSVAFILAFAAWFIHILGRSNSEIPEFQLIDLFVFGGLIGANILICYWKGERLTGRSGR